MQHNKIHGFDAGGQDFLEAVRQCGASSEDPPSLILVILTFPAPDIRHAVKVT